MIKFFPWESCLVVGLSPIDLVKLWDLNLHLLFSKMRDFDTSSCIFFFFLLFWVKICHSGKKNGIEDIFKKRRSTICETTVWVGLGSRFKTNCPLMGPGLTGGVPSVEVFLIHSLGIFFFHEEEMFKCITQNFFYQITFFSKKM